MNCAIIAAGGGGVRFGSPGGKQLALVAGLPVLAHTLLAFERCSAVDAVVVVTHPQKVDLYRREAVEPIGASKVMAVVPGGETRRASVAAGIEALPREAGLIAVHDGARAAVTPETIANAFAELVRRPDAAGVVVGHPCFDTVKRVDAAGHVADTVDREDLWIAQTPQVFRAEALRGAHERAAADGFEGTDDASLVERLGGLVVMVAGPRWNVKVTVPEDLEVLEALLSLREREES